ncbi:hypothetical protein BHS06_23630 [Myxococcus xanthus]|uniref:hypothetical protein n=1 Tax=Myxococcus xanthus TaxID=34 RepID=UPI00112AACCC|nr:hypothetical protein [Myxococcus xanthus]QDE91729.1 hypothetical protein BHS06_23630 [Myxococcus xanthus]
MSTCEGARALDEIARRWALHDGRILSIAARVADGGGVLLELVCSPRPESPVAELRIRFTGAIRIELGWTEEQEFYFVSGCKALVQPSGMVYLSLDPYDDTAAEIDSRDASVIEARGILAEFVMKSSWPG